MTFSTLPRPPDERFTLRQELGGWAITLAHRSMIARASAVTVSAVAAVAVVVLAWHMVFPSIGNASDPAAKHSPGLMAMAVFALIWGLYHLYHDFVFATLHVDNGRLRVTITWLRWTRQFAWEPGDIRAIGAWNGLHIAARSRSARLFPDWDLTGLSWVAEVLRGLLLVPEHLPPGPDEIMVHYTGSFWDRPVAGVLRAGDGELVLRHPLVAEPHLIFRAADDGRRVRSRGPIIRLRDNDIACRIHEKEPSQLTIAPDGVKADIQGSTPRIRVSILGPFLQRHIDLQPGCTDRRNLPSTDREFRMTFWCNDAEGLQHALARFWGSREEDQPR